MPVVFHAEGSKECFINFIYSFCTTYGEDRNEYLYLKELVKIANWVARVTKKMHSD